ncbi:MAG TPA: YraN family protein [Kofleriaceae bacterium]|nr:YraN family protein [Kofleriaceae bacterium]
MGRERLDYGEHGEDRAARALLARGYRIVERNFRCKAGELDLVARDHDDTLVFIEVRTRADDRHGGALAAVGFHKQRQVARVARFYLATRKPRFDTCRFDVVAITGSDLVVIKDAFRA